MRKKELNVTRQKWSKGENTLLERIVRDNKGLKWDQIAEKFNASAPTMKKTGKQCRERFRNYIDVCNINTKWTREEKILFVLLHSTYGNRWEEIAKFYEEKKDRTIKNFFFVYMRKVLRKVKTESNCSSIVCPPWKVLKLYYIIDLINLKYLPKLNIEDHENSSADQSITILNTIRRWKLGELHLRSFKEVLFNSFKNSYPTHTFPFILRIDIEKNCYDNVRRKTFNDIIKKQSFGELSSLIRIEVANTAKYQLTYNPRSYFNKSNYISQSIFIYLPYEQPSYSLIMPTLQVITPLFETPIHGDRKERVETNYWILSNFTLFHPIFPFQETNPISWVTGIYSLSASNEFYNKRIIEQAAKNPKQEECQVATLSNNQRNLPLNIENSRSKKLKCTEEERSVMKEINKA